MELLRSWHTIASPMFTAGLSYDLYNVGDSADTTVGGGGISASTTAGASHSNAFAIDQECESFVGKSSILNGINTLSQRIFFEGNINSTTPVGTTSYILDFYANYDIIFQIENGLISARY